MDLKIVIFSKYEDEKSYDYDSNYVGVIEGFPCVSEAKTKDDIQKKLVNHYIGHKLNIEEDLSWQHADPDLIEETTEHQEIADAIATVRYVKIK
jgi:hypothetical protein